jgi:thiamine-monophosphate kinase
MRGWQPILVPKWARLGKLFHIYLEISFEPFQMAISRLSEAMPSEDSRCLGDVGEDELVARLTAGLRLGGNVICGPGDDCAVLQGSDPEWLDLLKTDVVVEGIHFEPDADPEAVGWKAMARPLSDIAAMGGIPTAAVVTIVAPAKMKVSTAVAWYRGLQKAADRFGVSLVGGETSSTRSDAAVISVALTGRVESERCIYRSGAKVGDAILVTGRLGGSLESGRHLNFIPRIGEARWLSGNFELHSLMDLSDGLAKDLDRMMEQSRAGYRVDPAAVPCNEGVDWEAAVGDGEDFELLFTVSRKTVAALLPAWQARFGDELGLSVIGEVTDKTTNPLSGGWEHFANPSK